MDKESNQQQETTSPLLPNNNINIKIEEESVKKQPVLGGIAGNDRLKRDEWSEGAVSSLLEAYENKWILRNRAKLKGHDWEEVARYVSSRANGTKTPKTQTQCKNKIESMKKRYRSESATTDASSWPLYPRLDLLLRGSTASAAAVAHQTPPPQPITQAPSLPLTSANPGPSILLGPPPMVSQPQPVLLVTSHPPPPPSLPQAVIRNQEQNSQGSNGVDKVNKEDHPVSTKVSDQESDKNGMDTDSSTPAIYSDKKKSLEHKKKLMNIKMDNKNNKKKRKRREETEIADSVRWLAEAVIRSEQSRMETMKEIEKMRIEADAKRSEMDLKRTEIIANTQLEIAKLFATGVVKNVDSSLKIGRS